jgi:hypothetical protein
MIRIHGLLLIACSTIGFIGHYLQFGIARLTPWIPATVGLFIIFLDYFLKDKRSFNKYLSIIPVIVFGVLTTIMCIRFLPQESQPYRKKIIFTLMSISAWTVVGNQARLLFLEKKKRIRG